VAKSIEIILLIIMIKKSLLIGTSLLLLAGCGEIELPESNSVPTNAATIVSSQKEATPVDSETKTAEENTPVSIENISEEYKKVKSERDNLAEAIKISQEELKTCSLKKAELESKSSSQSAVVDMKKIAPILQKYLSETKQREYPFTLCGGMGKATSQSWYTDFTLQLEKSGIQFAPMHRALKPDDLSGVCASDQGKVAIFLGASYQGKKDFHLLKYNIESKVLEEAALLNGTCEVCPTKFGKRFGPVITLSGQSGAKTQNYEYYYDANIVKKK